MSRKVNESQKKEILNLFKTGKDIKDISKIYNFTIATITRQLKSLLGNEEFLKVKSFNLKKKKFNGIKMTTTAEAKLIKNRDNFSLNKTSNPEKTNNESTSFQEKFSDTPFFVELAPVDYEIDNSKQKDLSSISISEIDFPKVVYMVVDKKIELEIKLLKDFPEWEFLPKDDLNRKTIEIFFDLNLAKRSCNKDQKVLKVPNTDVFRIAAPVLLDKGISRIVCAENLIAL